MEIGILGVENLVGIKKRCNFVSIAPKEITNLFQGISDLNYIFVKLQDYAHKILCFGCIIKNDFL